MEPVCCLRCSGCHPKALRSRPSPGKDIHGRRRSSQQNHEMPAGLGWCPTGSTQQRTSSILPGDTKFGWKWSSRDLQVGDVDSIYLAKDWLEPIKQICTYCSKLKVCYGYIITEKELFVTRIRPFSQDHLRSPVNTQVCLSLVLRCEPRLSLQNHRKIPSRTYLQRLSNMGPWSTRLYHGAATQATIFSLLICPCGGII